MFVNPCSDLSQMDKVAFLLTMLSSSHFKDGCVAIARTFNLYHKGNRCNGYFIILMIFYLISTVAKVWYFRLIVVRASRSYIPNGIRKGVELVKLEIHNVFNSVCRNSIMQAGSFHLPENFVSMCYEETGTLFFCDYQIDSFASTINSLAHSPSSKSFFGIWTIAA